MDYKEFYIDPLFTETVKVSNISNKKEILSNIIDLFDNVDLTDYITKPMPMKG